MAKILLADDTVDARVIYRTIFEYGGHAVIEAADGVEAVEKAREHCPDIVVMDVTMPVMDGLEAIRRLKADVATRLIPVLVLTAHALASDREEAAQAGADAYLDKPCAPRTVLAEVERLLR